MYYMQRRREEDSHMLMKYLLNCTNPWRKAIKAPDCVQVQWPVDDLSSDLCDPRCLLVELIKIQNPLGFFQRADR